MTESPYPLISIEEAWRRIAAVVRPLRPALQPIGTVLGRILAEDVIADESIPALPSSAMDGYAVIAGDRAPRLRVIEEQAAGREKGLHVVAGTAVRIMTGAPLPQGADAVVLVEDAIEQDGLLRVLTAISAGEYVRPVGQDLAAGDLVLSKGSLLGPPEIGLLAAVGRAEVLVYPRPKVAVMATGDELIPPHCKPKPGELRDSNSYALCAAIEAAGCEPLHLGIIPDDEKALRTAILDGVAHADMLLTSGGVSMGRLDFVKPLLAELGKVHFGRVAIKPGKPLTFATLQDLPVFGLPGFPVSSLLSFENFVRPALRLIGGHRALWRPRVHARLRHYLRHSTGRTEFQRAVVTEEDGLYWAESTGLQVSGRLKSLVGANALLQLPADVDDFERGDEVVAILIDRPEIEALAPGSSDPR
ncbi:molybdopterin molybdotransferase MoeA [Candidatus Bipolaricaulota bacterium]|nr:molybdopterin molybdotransferase MoeA [Candidatus Bipolaricaulota bacterium]